METTKTQPLPNGDRGPARRRRWPTLLTVFGTMLATVAVILGGRFLVGPNLAFFEQVEPGITCAATERIDGNYCLKWVSYPDLLVQEGRDEVHLYVKGQEGGRFYSVPDPFPGGSSGVDIAWPEEGLSISDGSITLTWSDEALVSLLTD